MTSNITTTVSTTPTIAGNTVPTATPEVDEEEFIAKPPDHAWNKNGSPQKSNCCQLLSSTLFNVLLFLPFLFLDKFYSSSDSDSEDEIERKIHVEIKPLNNGTDKISASVDELRATVENLSLSPIGVLSVINFAFFRVLLYRFSLKNHEKLLFL